MVTCLQNWDIPSSQSPQNPATKSVGAMWAPQRVLVEPDCQTLYGAHILSQKSFLCDIKSTVDHLFVPQQEFWILYVNKQKFYGNYW